MLATPEIPELGPGPRPQVQSLKELNRNFDDWVGRATPLPAQIELLRCVVWLWHDHHDAAHELCQSMETPDGSWLHGLLHRREPDYGNARYWFLRVGRHPGFPLLAERVARLLSSSGEPERAAQLLPGGDWDPFAFIAACAQAAGRSGTQTQRRSLRQIQALEFEVLLEYFWNQSAVPE